MRIRCCFASVLLPAIGVLVIASGAAGRAEEPVFEEIASKVGIDYQHFNGMTGEMYFPEMTGQGVAVLDYDGDADLDIFLTQGTLIDVAKSMADALFPTASPPTERLFRNDSVPGGGGLSFTDVSAEAGFSASGYGMGVATGDIDNDGDVDLYLTNFDSNQLLVNLGDGRFEDKAALAGVDDAQWSVSASFADIDRDGDLDLLVVDYVDFTVANQVKCYAPSSRRDYCGPSAYPGVADRLFRNRGDGTFEDVSIASGVGRPKLPGLGVVAADFDGDGWQDFYVTNDGEANFLWLNQRDGTFIDEALLAGVAVNRMGAAEASMGVTAADIDDDGDQDLLMTHLAGESNTLYINQGQALFEDRTAEHSLAAPSFPFTSFGTAFVDFDSDGWLDLMVVSGAVKILEPLAQAGDLFPLDQENQLYRNQGGAKGFVDVSAVAGGGIDHSEVSRGLAVGDLDNDGALDLVVGNNNGRLRVLRNVRSPGNQWLGLRLVDRNGRDAYGALAELTLTDDRRITRRVATDGSYASASDPRVHFGLRNQVPPKGLLVRWPDGSSQAVELPALGRYSTIRQLAAAARGAGGE